MGPRGKIGRSGPAGPPGQNGPPGDPGQNVSYVSLISLRYFITSLSYRFLVLEKACSQRITAKF